MDKIILVKHTYFFYCNISNGFSNIISNKVIIFCKFSTLTTFLKTLYSTNKGAFFTTIADFEILQYIKHN